MSGTLPANVDKDDLFQAGVIGLIQAISRFDPSRNVGLRSFAKHRVRGAMLDQLRGIDWASRDARRFEKKVEEITLELSSQLRRNPTSGEVSEKLGKDLTDMQKWVLAGSLTGLVVSMTALVEDHAAGDEGAQASFHPDSRFASVELEETLGRASSGLPKRYQRVIRLYYWEGMTMKEIGGILGVNESRISQMHKRALELMGDALSEMGIDNLCQLLD